jgi:type I restriction enzyme S subunit
LNDTNAKKLFLPLPPLNEQAQIVKKIDILFNNLDESIKKFNEAKLKLKQYRESVLISAFTGQLTKLWRKKYSNKLLIGKESQKINEISQLDRNDSNIFPNIPTSWFSCKLEMIIEKPTYGTSKKTDYQSNGIGVLRIPNIINGKINDNDLKYADFNKLEKEKYSLLSGDLLVIRSNGSLNILGKSALVTKLDEKYLFAGYLIRIRPNNKIILSELLQYIFQSYNLRKQITKKAKSSSGINNINSLELRNLIIPLMSIEEQTQIIKEIKTRLNIAKEMEQSIDINLSKAKTMYQSILTKAFKGELVDSIDLEEKFTAKELLMQIQLEKRKYEEEQKNKKKRKIRSKKVAKKLSLIETLTKAKNNVLKAEELWKNSIYSNDIEAFYSKLKEEIEVNKTIVESKNADNNESYLRLANAN